MTTAAVKKHFLKQKELRADIATMVTLVSFGMLFATLFLGYAVFRLTAPSWPPADVVAFDLTIPSLSTFWVLFSSWAFFKFEKELSKKWLSASLVTGLLFIGTQFMLWRSLESAGIFVGAGAFSSIIYAITWIHAAHMVLGGLALAWLLFFGKVENKLLNKSVGSFWHFLTVIWILVYIFVFVL